MTKKLRYRRYKYISKKPYEEIFKPQPKPIVYPPIETRPEYENLFSFYELTMNFDRVIFDCIPGITDELMNIKKGEVVRVCRNSVMRPGYFMIDPITMEFKDICFGKHSKLWESIEIHESRPEDSLFNINKLFSYNTESIKFLNKEISW